MIDSFFEIRPSIVDYFQKFYPFILDKFLFSGYNGFGEVISCSMIC